MERSEPAGQPAGRDYPRYLRLAVHYPVVRSRKWQDSKVSYPLTLTLYLTPLMPAKRPYCPCRKIGQNLPK